MFLDLSQLPDDEAILDAYLRAGPPGVDGEEPWPVDAFRILIPRDPERAWKLICALIERAPDPILSTIGVSQLEEFVSRHGVAFAGRIEREAERSGRFVEALANVWLTRGAFPPDVEARLLAASRGTMTILDDMDA